MLEEDWRRYMEISEQGHEVNNNPAPEDEMVYLMKFSDGNTRMMNQKQWERYSALLDQEEEFERKEQEFREKNARLKQMQADKEGEANG